VNKPLISFPVVAYNQERFVAEAVKGAFSQTYSPLEIILSDDCSPDRTFEIMREMATSFKGPHKVILNRNEKNLGIGGHVNRIMELANGELIVPSAGDDISIPARVDRIYPEWRSSNGRVKSLYSNAVIIDALGKTRGLLFKPGTQTHFSLQRLVLESVCPVLGSSHAWSRDVFDRFGPMKTPLIREDMVIPFRSALFGKVQYIDEPLVYYRRHPGNFVEVSRRLNDFPSFLSGMKTWTSDFKSIYANWLAALAKLSSFAPERQKEIRNLRKIIERKLMVAESEIELFDSGLRTRIRLLAELAVKAGPRRRTLFWIAVFFLPAIYRQYLKLKSLREKADSDL
jgi:glycosyltransferase involved in cell wall biosynthesis